MNTLLVPGLRVIEMDEKTKRLLYTTKDGRFYWETDYANDQLELDEEDIDFDRIPRIRELLQPGAVREHLSVPLEAALILTSCGDEQGLEYLKYVVSLSEEELYGAGANYNHRLGDYDTIFEWVAEAAGFFGEKYKKRTGKDDARERVYPLISRILELCETQKFEFKFLFDIEYDKLTEYDEGLRSYLRAMLADESGFHHHKPADAVKFFAEYDPEYLEVALAEAGKTKSDYP